MEGYDHIVDVLDDNATIFQVASDRKQTAVIGFLESINGFEVSEQIIHRQSPVRRIPSGVPYKPKPVIIYRKLILASSVCCELNDCPVMYTYIQ